MKIEIGPMCPTLRDQLKGIKYDKARVAVLERDHRELSRLYVRGYVPRAVFTQAGRKLIKRLEGYIANAVRTGPPASGGTVPHMVGHSGEERP